MLATPKLLYVFLSLTAALEDRSIAGDPYELPMNEFLCFWLVLACITPWELNMEPLRMHLQTESNVELAYVPLMVSLKRPGKKAWNP